MKKLISLIAALMIIGSVAAQKKVQKLLFPQEYIYGDDNRFANGLGTMYVGYTDGTRGSVPLDSVIIKGLDNPTIGLQKFTVEYDGVIQEYTALVSDEEFGYEVDDKKRAFCRKYGINLTNIYSWWSYLNHHRDFVWVTKKEIKSVVIEDLGIEDYAFNYYYGQDFFGNVEGVRIHLSILYANGQGTEVSMPYPVSVSKFGKQDFYFDYAGKKYKTRVNVIGVDSIIDFPSKIYSNDKTQPKIKVRYTDGQEGYVNKAFIVVNGLDSTKSGVQNVTVECGGVIQHFTTDFIKVSEHRTIDSVLIVNVPVKRDKGVKWKSELPVGGYINSFYVKYRDGNDGLISAEDAVITGLDVSTPGKKNVTIQYSGQTISTVVEVFKQPVSLDLTNVSDKVYQFGKLSGTFKAIYQDGSSEMVDISQAYYSLDDTDEIGCFNTTIVWHGCYEYLDVSVIANPNKPVKFDFSEVNTELLEYEKPRGNIKAIYSDGTFDMFDISHTTYTLDTKSLGKKRIDVSWHGLSAPLDVTVNSDPAKPELKDGLYYIETEAALLWWMRCFRAGNTEGHDCILTTKIFTNKTPEIKEMVKTDIISGLSVSATIRGFTQSQESRSGRFTNAQKQLMSGAIKQGSKIYIEDIQCISDDGQKIYFGALTIQL